MKSAWGISASGFVFTDRNEMVSSLENNSFLDGKDHAVISFCKCKQTVLLDNNTMKTSKKNIFPNLKTIANKKEEEELF